MRRNTNLQFDRRKLVDLIYSEKADISSLDMKV
jgi:hypothetical protein